MLPAAKDTMAQHAGVPFLLHPNTQHALTSTSVASAAWLVAAQNLTVTLVASIASMPSMEELQLG